MCLESTILSKSLAGGGRGDADSTLLKCRNGRSLSNFFGKLREMKERMKAIQYSRNWVLFWNKNKSKFSKTARIQIYRHVITTEKSPKRVKTRKSGIYLRKSTHRNRFKYFFRLNELHNTLRFLLRFLISV